MAEDYRLMRLASLLAGQPSLMSGEPTGPLSGSLMAPAGATHQVSGPAVPQPSLMDRYTDWYNRGGLAGMLGMEPWDRRPLMDTVEGFVGSTTPTRGALTSLMSRTTHPGSGLLSDFTPTLYRETSPDRALEFLPGSSAWPPDMVGQDFYMSGLRDLALGQGDNTGVVITFDAKKLLGTQDKSKPAWEQAQEFIARGNSQTDYRDAVRSFRIKNDMGGPAWARRNLINLAERLEKEGWQRVVGDGYTEWIRP